MLKEKGQTSCSNQKTHKIYWGSAQKQCTESAASLNFLHRLNRRKTNNPLNHYYQSKLKQFKDLFERSKWRGKEPQRPKRCVRRGGWEKFQLNCYCPFPTKACPKSGNGRLGHALTSRAMFLHYVFLIAGGWAVLSFFSLLYLLRLPPWSDNWTLESTLPFLLPGLLPLVLTAKFAQFSQANVVLLGDWKDMEGGGKLQICKKTLQDFVFPQQIICVGEKWIEPREAVPGILYSLHSSSCAILKCYWAQAK